MEHNPTHIGFAWAIVRAIVGPIVEMAVSWLLWSLLLAAPIYFMLTNNLYCILYILGAHTLITRTYCEAKVWAEHKRLIYNYIILIEAIVACIWLFAFLSRSASVYEFLFLSTMGWLGVLLTVGSFRRLVCLLSGGASYGLSFFLLFTALTVAAIGGVLGGAIVALLTGVTGELHDSQLLGVGYWTAGRATLLLAVSVVWSVIWCIVVCKAPGRPRAIENYAAAKRLEAILASLGDGPRGRAA
jgi:hypothetical protein